MSVKFGDQRLVRPDVGGAHRALYRAMGIPDPAHWLHFKYFERALGLLDVRAPERILDAGCGAGDYSFHLARLFPAAKVLSVDINEELLARNREVARRLGIQNIEFDRIDLTRLDMPETFDFIVSIDVLEHVEPQDQAFANLARSLRPGGSAFYHVPTIREVPVPFSARLQGFHDWAHEEHIADDLNHHEVDEAVRRSGLEIVDSRRTFGWYTGELATSLFTLPFADTTANRILQAVAAPVCRVLAAADSLGLDSTRYAVGVCARRPHAAA